MTLLVKEDLPTPDCPRTNTSSLSVFGISVVKFASNLTMLLSVFVMRWKHDRRIDTSSSLPNSSSSDIVEVIVLMCYCYIITRVNIYMLTAKFSSCYVSSHNNKYWYRMYPAMPHVKSSLKSHKSVCNFENTPKARTKAISRTYYSSEMANFINMCVLSQYSKNRAMIALRSYS